MGLPAWCCDNSSPCNPLEALLDDSLRKRDPLPDPVAASRMPPIITVLDGVGWPLLGLGIEDMDPCTTVFSTVNAGMSIVLVAALTGNSKEDICSLLVMT